MVRRLPYFLGAALAAAALHSPLGLVAQDQPLQDPSTATTQEPSRPGRSPAARSNRIYVVQMTDLPVSSYDGGVQGFAATKPPKGQKLDRETPEALAYAARLEARHDDLLGRVGGRRKIYDYRYTFNGFAAELT